VREIIVADICNGVYSLLAKEIPCTECSICKSKKLATNCFLTHRNLITVRKPNKRLKNRGLQKKELGRGGADPHQIQPRHADPQHLFSSYKHNNPHKLSHFRTAYYNRILSSNPDINLAYLLSELILFSVLYICSVKIIMEEQYFLSLPVPTGTFSCQLSLNVLLSAILLPIVFICIILLWSNLFLISPIRITVFYR